MQSETTAPQLRQSALSANGDSTTILLNERAKTHGSFTDHARITQLLKAIVHSEPHWQHALTMCQRESVDMILHKIGRIMAGNPSFKDHWDDIAGYARLVADQCPK